MAKKHRQKPDNLLAQNKKAGHDYNILDTYEAGIALTGTEIKSVRDGKLNLRDNVDPMRNRKLLLHKKEIRKLGQMTARQGVTLVPLRMYLKHGYAKVLIGVAEGKHNYDKRETLKRKDQEREVQRALKARY